MLRVVGQVGAVRVGYQVAAEFSAWTLVSEPRLPRAFQLDARVRVFSDYWLTQAPLDLHLEVGAERWTWRDVRPTLAEGALTMTLRTPPTVTAAPVLATKEAAVWGRSGR